PGHRAGLDGQLQAVDPVRGQDAGGGGGRGQVDGAQVAAAVVLQREGAGAGKSRVEALVRSIETVPELMVVATGVVLSVKEPKVPMPATAAAAPMTPSEPTTLRAVELVAILVLMSRTPCVRVTGVSGDRENS